MSSKPGEGTGLRGHGNLNSNLHVSEIHEENEQDEAGTTFKRHPPPNNNQIEHEGLHLKLDE
jgi:hypothetical protein